MNTNLNILKFSLLLTLAYLPAYAGMGHSCSDQQIRNGCQTEYQCTPANNPHHENCGDVCSCPTHEESLPPSLTVNADEETMKDMEVFFQNRTGAGCCNGHDGRIRRRPPGDGNLGSRCHSALPLEGARPAAGRRQARASSGQRDDAADGWLLLRHQPWRCLVHSRRAGCR